MKRAVEVVGAVIVRDAVVLCARRGQHGDLPGLWEFPGGKVEPGETPRPALAREIAEELACSVEVGELVATTTHEYERAIVTLSTFYCSLVDGDPRPTEHAELAWLPPSELSSLEWAPADLPTVEKLRSVGTGP